MKKAIVISALMLTCLTVFEACKKSEETIAVPVEATLAVELKANQSYTYTLPALTGTQTFHIVKSSAHNATTNIVVDATGNMQLVYTPAIDYTGSDEIALSTLPADSCLGNKPPHHGMHPGGPHGNCDGKNNNHSKRHHDHPHPKLKLPLLHKKKCNKDENTTETKILIHFNITSDETITTVN